MKLAKAMIGGLLLAAAPLAAMADDMSYSYVDLGYAQTDIDGVGPSADGFGLRGSIGFARELVRVRRATRPRASRASISTRSRSASAGTTASPKASTWSAASATSKSTSTPVADSTPMTTATSLDAGLRGRVGDAVELEGGVHYTDLSDGGDDTALFVGGRFHFNKTWALGAEYASGDDVSSIFAYVRASF